MIVAAEDRVAVDGRRAVHVIDAATGRVLSETDRLTTAWVLTDGKVIGTRDDAFAAIAVDSAGQGGSRPGSGTTESRSRGGAARAGDTTGRRQTARPSRPREVDPVSGEVRWSVPVEQVWRTHGVGAVPGED